MQYRARLFLDTHNNQCTLIEFGEHYMGKSKVFMGSYVNNTPKSYSYKIVTRKGIHSNQDELINLFTPNDLGIEQAEKVIHVEPSGGIIKPFSSHQI
jgi:hypothetical protein